MSLEILIQPQLFSWEPSVTPFSSPYTLAWASCGYLLGIGLLSWTIRKPLPVPKFLAPAHNLGLCLLSLVMVVGTVKEVLQTSSGQGGYDWIFCMPPGTKVKVRVYKRSNTSHQKASATDGLYLISDSFSIVEGPVFYWSYIYYLSKYLEFVDTLLLVLKAKPLSVLHVFHHAVVPTMAFLWLDTAQSLQHLGLLTNAGVHVIMYLYYFLCSIGIYPRWKPLITQCQIVQFVWSFITLLPFGYFYTTRPEGCAGAGALLFNGAFNFLLLILFIQFSSRTYRKKPQKAA